MSSTARNFDVATSYENFMGGWSRLVGEAFLDWLDPPVGLVWADIGCGNGCFTEQLFQRAQPSMAHGLDTSEKLLAQARELLRGMPTTLRQGDAQALPFPDHSIDAAVMALVLFFLPDPPKGLGEMIRVTRPGGLVSAYVWDLTIGGQPWNATVRGRDALGLPYLGPPSQEITGLAALEALWRTSGLEQVEARHFEVSRRFANFATYWRDWSGGPMFQAMPTEHISPVRQATLQVLGCGEDEPFTVTAVASAVKGVVRES